MWLGMTRGEWALVVFLFALIFGAQYVPKLGGYIGEKLGRRGPR
jgi:hypothetical protein